MLIGQASINLTAKVPSAPFGLASAFVFRRLFSPRDYGVYLLGVGFASVVSVVLVSWFRNLILSGDARNGPDVRGVVISGYLIWCLTAPLPTALRGRSAWVSGSRGSKRAPASQPSSALSDTGISNTIKWPERSPGCVPFPARKGLSDKVGGRSVQRVLSGRRIQSSSGRLRSSNLTDLATGTFGRSTMAGITGPTTRGSVPRVEVSRV